MSPNWLSSPGVLPPAAIRCAPIPTCPPWQASVPLIGAASKLSPNISAVPRRFWFARADRPRALAQHHLVAFDLDAGKFAEEALAEKRLLPAVEHNRVEPLGAQRTELDPVQLYKLAV